MWFVSRAKVAGVCTVSISKGRSQATPTSSRIFVPSCQSSRSSTVQLRVLAQNQRVQFQRANNSLKSDAAKPRTLG